MPFEMALQEAAPGEVLNDGDDETER